MRKALFVALCLAVPVGWPSGAAAHPEGSAGAFGGATSWLIPTAEEGQETKDSAATTGTNAGVSKNLKVIAQVGKNELKNINSDLAFWGQYAIMGNYDGFAILDISEPESPTYVSEPFCPGSQNDVSVYRNIIVTSTDSQRNDDSCNSRPFSRAAGDTVPWEGLRIWDWSNPADPQYIRAVPTDCGSHTHTTVPDLENNRLIIYVSSYSPNNTPNCVAPHDKISVVEVPLDAPGQAHVISEPVLFPGTTGGPSTSGCHDITAYPAKDLALGACMGDGIVMDISDPADPQVIARMKDPNFSFWHSATFSDDGDVAVFTDELGGGTAPRCRAQDPGNRGANAYYDISDPEQPVFKSYFKIQNLDKGRVQTAQENCVSHNGSLIPSKFGRDLMVQAWYQGGTNVVDFTDPAKPFEVAFFDRPADPDNAVGGHWSSYAYNGEIYASEIGRGFDVMKLTGPFDDGGARQPYLNAQTQEPLNRR